MFTEVNGYRWPAGDTFCRLAAFDEVANLEFVLPRVTNRDACVQAGGNCGVWPNALAAHFGTVYTFEPDPVNFACLAHNVTAPNVVKLQAALGRGDELPADMRRNPENCGAYQLLGAGSIPVLTIDSLNLPSCGLIYLDIEGYEPRALQGALKTLRRCRPVIALEMKGIAAVYGVTDEQITHALAAEGYQAKGRVGRDTVFLPC